MNSLSPQPLWVHWEPRYKTTAQAQSHCCQHRGRHGISQSHSNGDHTPHLLSAGHKHICRYVQWCVGFLFPANLHFFPFIFQFGLLSRCTHSYKSELTTVSLVPFIQIRYLFFACFTVYIGCCRSYMKTRISFKAIKGYSVQIITEMCPINAIMWVSTSVLHVLYVLNNILT